METPHSQSITSADQEDLVTLEQFIIDRQQQFPHSTGSFSRLLRDISVAAKLVNRDIRRAGLVDVLGSTGETNVQGELQMKLDARAHKELVRALRRGGVCSLIGSEEHAEAIPIKPSGPDDGKYIVLMDPLDGSSNIDVNVSVGTIFSIYSLPPGTDEPAPGDALQPGAAQAAAGYVVYGSSTMLVYTTGSGVNGFTLEPSIGEFILSHRNIELPKQGRTYSINAGYWNSFPEGLVRYLEWIRQDDAEAHSDGRPYTTRYIGSFVSDFHRNLLRGGIYLYPAIRSSPEGKLRLMYEANPMAFIAEQAGGRASDGARRILDIQPSKLHQRTPLFIGSEAMVQQVEEFLQDE